MPKKTSTATGQDSQSASAADIQGDPTLTPPSSLSGDGAAGEPHGDEPLSDGSSGTPDATTQPTSTPETGVGITPIAVDVNCPSGRPEDPFGPTLEAPFGFYKAGEKQGQPKPNGAGRPPNRSPRDARPDDAADRERVSSVKRAPPRKAKPNGAAAPAALPGAQLATVAVDYEAMGQGAANLWFNVGCLAFGKDWEPNTEQREHIVVAHAFRDYFRSKQLPDFPPGVALCVVLVTYSLGRVTKPEVKSRLAVVGSSIKKGMSWLGNKMPRFGRSSRPASTAPTMASP